ncbi:MAG TPA: ABC transporter ATP-binding protein [Candidatus Binatia bacterium]|jgi:iron complex transport system ATP-binding protein
MTAAIEVEKLFFAYGRRRVLDGVSLAIQKGEMIGVLGPNGSGKTTLLKIFSGVLAAGGGVRIAGRPVEAYSRGELSRMIAVVPQESEIHFPFTAAEIVLMARASHHGRLALENAADLEAARRSMAATDTAALADRWVHELSGGEKQRVMIARALAQEADILLMDEPAAFLDLKHQLGVFDLMRRLNRERGLTIVAALHDLNLSALFFPRLLLLENGKIHRDGAPEEVLTEDTIRQVYGVEVRVERRAPERRPHIFLRR